ncbi:MAG TPA: AAA family ATPase [Solirubrobacteraceae bacterium]|nr:AAA family ATPase [Solirubrobacteraceae bacterium]
MAAAATETDPGNDPAAGGGGAPPGLEEVLEAQPHARAVLAGLAEDPAGASHAYLLYGPPGTGKRAAARALAVSLLSSGARNPATVAGRVARDAHPDLTWVSPSGASEMLVSDIEEPVVAAATRTPFESARRVFVIESVEAMNDQSANRMLKTLEEPRDFVHLLLLSDRLDDVLPTIVSRCQLVRFDPVPADRIAAALTGVEEPRAQACARLALGDAGLAAWLAAEEGEGLRRDAEGYVRQAISGASASRAWLRLIEQATGAGAHASEADAAAAEQDLELLPARERKRQERELLDARRRSERRARTRMLDLSLRLAELWLRDLMCVCEGAPELIYAVDRRTEIESDAHGRRGRELRDALDLVAGTRLSLSLNVSEELALEALSYRLEARLGVATP